MAVEDHAGRADAAAALDEAMQSRGTRRMYFGTNVLLMVLFAFALLVLVNWLAQRRYYRRDLSSLGAYSLSDRTKNIIDSTEGKIRLTSIYTSDDPEKDRDKYLPRVRDLLEEFAQYSDRVVVQNISEDAEKRKLAARIEATFTEQAAQHRETLSAARKRCEDLKNWAQEEVTKFFAPIEVRNGWLTHFTSFTNSRINLQALSKRIDTELEGVQLLTTGELPKYAEANTRIKSLNQELKRSLEEIGGFLSELGELTRSIQSGEETFFAEAPAKLEELRALRAELVRGVGAPADPMPDDPVPALKECARVGSKLSTWLVAEIGRIDEFTRRHPVVNQHPLWHFRRRVAILVTQTTLPQLLADVQKDLADMRPQITRIISADLDQRKLQNTLERVRQFVAQFDATLEDAAAALASLKEDFAQIDPASQTLLSAEHYESQFKPQIDALGELIEQTDELPELEVGELGDQLRQDNVIVIEANKKASVVTFDEVWPFAGQGRFSIDTGDRKRVFNGDAAVSQALLSLVHDKPFATVVFTHYEVDVPENMRRFLPPVTGDIPLYRTSGLQERLKDANFEVKVWNVARDPQQPDVDEDVPVIYLVLPPPDPRLAPPGMGTQIDTWDQADEKKITDSIGKRGRAIFLATYSVPRAGGPFGSGPAIQYDYVLKDYLHREWGVDVDVRYRVIYGKRDPKDPTRFGVSLGDWQWLPLNSFTDHPIGRPLRARRVYMLNVCPVNTSDAPPPGVEAWDVLGIEEREDIWGNHNVIRTVHVITDPRSGGWIRKDFDPSDGWMDISTPFSVMAAARNADGGKVFVTGSGQSYIDGYLDAPIARGAVNERITFDPPPTANADLLINALYWLADQEDLIASGPILTPVIRPVGKAERRWLGAGVMLWSVLALAAGGAVLFTRRK